MGTDFQQVVVEVMDACFQEVEPQTVNLTFRGTVALCETVLLRRFQPNFAFVAEQIAREARVDPPYRGPEDAPRMLRVLATQLAKRVWDEPLLVRDEP